MGTGIRSATETTVTLVRLGHGKEDLTMPNGSTLADLLRAAGATDGDHDVSIDGRPLAECLVLKPGAIVALAPRRPSVPHVAPPRGAVGAFRDDPEFAAMLEELERERGAEKDLS